MPPYTNPSVTCCTVLTKMAVLPRTTSRKDRRRSKTNCRNRPALGPRRRVLARSWVSNLVFFGSLGQVNDDVLFWAAWASCSTRSRACSTVSSSMGCREMQSKTCSDVPMPDGAG
eukprot:scaffold10845_cov156-Amphora_coffeaeformis.AAC.3